MPADHLAQHTKVPRRYSCTILQEFVRAKLVRSQSRPGSGHGLVRAARDTTILDVVNAGRLLERIRRCPLGLGTHTRFSLAQGIGRCLSRDRKALGRVTIPQLVDSISEIVLLCGGEKLSLTLPRFARGISTTSTFRKFEVKRWVLLATMNIKAANI
jgi:Rrf2 family transcriptional regulator, nitric oxide-sensitive transcriptional repressor